MSEKLVLVPVLTKSIEEEEVFANVKDKGKPIFYYKIGVYLMK